MSRETVKTQRPKRSSINGTRNILNVQGKDPNYVYRIVNDDGDRVSQFEGMGYEIVTDKSVKIGDRRVANPTQEGTPVQVSVGGGQKAFLMRISREWYDEDQLNKQTQLNELESNMKNEALQTSDYGKLKISRD